MLLTSTKFNYFEVARLLLVIGGRNYEDNRHIMELWPSEKPRLYDKDNIEAFKIDQVVQLGNDMVAAFEIAGYEKNEAKKAKVLKNSKDVEVPKYADVFEKLLKESGTGYFVGDSLTLPDIFVYELVCYYSKRQISLTDGCPHLKALVQKVESNDKIKEYLANRKETEN